MIEPVQLSPIGHTDLAVSRLGYGTTALGNIMRA